MASKYAAKGTKLQINTGSVLTDIPSIESFTFGQGETELIDSTTLDSGNYREFLNGFKNSDEITAEIVYDPADTVHAFLQANHGGTAKPMKVILASVGTHNFTFNALITKFSLPIERDGLLRVSVTFKPTGNITYSAT